MYINMILTLVFFACAAMMWQGGLWSNAIIFFNAVTSALIASTLWEPVADWLQSKEPSYTYVWDFLSIWGVFTISMSILRWITDMLSSVKVKFKQPVHMAGGLFFAAWTGWVMVCFTTFSLHTAPLVRNFFDGTFQANPTDKMLYGLAPDRHWLGFVQKESIGALSGSSEFDPRAEFILKYGERRARFDKEQTVRVGGAAK
jgi:hypothetical protein